MLLILSETRTLAVSVHEFNSNVTFGKHVARVLYASQLQRKEELRQ